jgi:microcystin-dependent protein
MLPSLKDQFIDEAYAGLLHTATQPISGDNFAKVYDGKGNESPISLRGNDIKFGDVEYDTIGGGVGNVLRLVEVDKSEFDADSNLLDVIYPIGSVFLSITGTSPATTMGGSWTRVTEGRFLAGVGTGNDGSVSEDFPLGNGGGKYFHTLTTSEMPSHNHTGYTGTRGAGGIVVSELKPTILDGVSSLVHEGDYHTSARGINKTLKLNGQLFFDPPYSGDQPHNNIPPSFGIYIWQRTA